jgi:hypothetical protein
MKSSPAPQRRRNSPKAPRGSRPCRKFEQAFAHGESEYGPAAEFGSIASSNLVTEHSRVSKLEPDCKEKKTLFHG